jgi:hypothetical protein
MDMSRKKKVGYEEVPGNSVASVANYQRVLIKTAEALYGYEPKLDRLFEDDVIVTGLSIRHPIDEGTDYLLTARATIGGERFVAFHGGDTLVECL